MLNCFFDSPHCAGPITPGVRTRRLTETGYCEVHLRGCVERAAWDYKDRRPRGGRLAVIRGESL